MTALHTINGTAVEDSGEDSGAGPPVVLVHGLGLNRAMWRWQMPALETRFRVIRYDLYGHGESAPPPGLKTGPPTLAMFADQLAGVLDGLGVQRAAVIGFSLGGMIVRRFIMDYPGRAAALGILNSAHNRTAAERDAVMKRARLAAAEGPAATVDAALERWFTPGFAEQNSDVLKLVRGWVTANDPNIYPQIYKILAEGDAEITESLAAFDGLVLVMTAENDTGAPPETARRMAASAQNAKTVILPDLRHMALAEDPEAVNNALLSFLERALPVIKVR